MNTVEINIAQCKTAEELHVVLSNALGFPDYYGKNLDALWDCLSEFEEHSMTVKLRGFKIAHDTIGDYVNKVLEVFRQAELHIKGFNVVVD